MPSSAATPKNFISIHDSSTRVQQGLCPIAKIRQNEQSSTLHSHDIYFELHGTGPKKLVFIMGLNNTSFAWAGQVEYFARKEEYSVLVFDNRGVGNSGAPRGPYSTSEMAEDAIVLLDYIGWTAPRDLHIIGVSLGGMIAQELAYRIPHRITSLLLAVTTPGSPFFWNNLPPRKGMISLATLLTIKEPGKKIPYVLDTIYPKSWVDAIADPEDDPVGVAQGKRRTNGELQAADFIHRVEITTPQPLIGALSQMVSGLTHYVSSARLRTIADSIPKVLIVTGDDDHLVHPSKSHALKAAMPQAELLEWKETGHGIHTQRRRRFNQLIERVVSEGNARLDGSLCATTDAA